jgi:very-short-patch-repair endonuclease
MARFASIDSEISAIAGPQGGYIHQRQLAKLALTADAIYHRVLRGSLIPAYYRVYAVGHVPTDPISRAKGALLAAGPRSALGDISSGSYYGIFRHWRYPLHVIVPTDRRINGLVIHRNRRLLRSDVVSPEPGLRVVSPALALLESAQYLSEKRLRRVANEIRLKHRIELNELQALVDRFPRHPGVPVLTPIVATSQRQPTRSAWEDEWPAFAASHQLPPYVMNEFVEGHRTDVLFLSAQVIVELDGWDTHQTHEAFSADREQDAVILAKTGIPTVRVTYERLHHHPQREADRLHTILGRRRAQLQLRAG